MAVSPAYISQQAARMGLDPRAVLAVAGQEGLGGGIGDGGHAYGPFQLNNAGGVITGSHPGTYSQPIQQWAWSPQGIAYALSQIAGDARGLHGERAVDAIVSRFERPADIPGEIARALASYGGQAAGPAGGAAPPTVPSPPGGAAPPVAPDRAAGLQAVQELMRSFTQPAAGSVSPVLQALQTYRNGGTR